MGQTMQQQQRQLSGSPKTVAVLSNGQAVAVSLIAGLEYSITIQQLQDSVSTGGASSTMHCISHLCSALA